MTLVNFTRRLPGIRRPALGGPLDDGLSLAQPTPGGWTVALVYVGLFVPVDIYLFCTFRFGEDLGLGDPQLLGLSYLGLLGVVNAALFVWVAGEYWVGGIRRTGLRGTRALGTLLALVLLGLKQYEILRWRSLVEWLQQYVR